MNKTVIYSLLGLIILTIASCASAPKTKEPMVFFPPAPELPRIQYLTSFAGLKDIETQSSFNKFVAGEKKNLRMDKPYGAGIYNGKIYVCDTNGPVVIIDLNKKSYTFLRAATTGPGKLIQPLNISIEDNGTKFITDPIRKQIVVFDQNDNYVTAYGTPDDNWRPVDAVSFGDLLYVADIENALIKVFDKASGEIVKTIGNKGERAEGLNRPTNLAFDREGYLYVTDIGRFQVVKYDRDGHFKDAFGKPGDNLGHFARPKGIAVDQEGHIYVVDAAFNNVQVFNNEGRLLLFFGSGGSDPGQFFLPAQVVIDYKNTQYFQKYADPNFQIEYLLLVTSQLEKRSVSVLAYGKQKGKKYPTDQELRQLIEKKKKEALEKQQKS